MLMRIAAALALMSLACRGGENRDAVADTSASTGTAQQGSAINAAYAATPAVQTVDKDAVAALDRMATYLRSIKSFRVTALTTRDEVLTNGQKAQYATTQDVLLEKPNKLLAKIDNDGGRRFLFYDGKTFTLWADGPRYYASVPAPGNISQLSDQLEKKFGIELPLRDLFLWGTDNQRGGAFTSAVDLGPSQIEGTSVEQYAFRQDGFDWQIWIQKGDYPLPRKLIITTLTDDARPDYTAVFDWNLAPSFNDAIFTFDPPDGAKKIVLAQADTMSASK